MPEHAPGVLVAEHRAVRERYIAEEGQQPRDDGRGAGDHAVHLFAEARLIGHRPNGGNALKVRAEIRVPGQVQPPGEEQLLLVRDVRGGGRGLLEDLVNALEVRDAQ